MAHVLVHGTPLLPSIQRICHPEHADPLGSCTVPLILPMLTISAFDCLRSLVQPRNHVQIRPISSGSTSPYSLNS
jgi:hypothetical protein